jgi:hypothetical protein
MGRNVAEMAQLQTSCLANKRKTFTPHKNIEIFHVAEKSQPSCLPMEILFFFSLGLRRRRAIDLYFFSP